MRNYFSLSKKEQELMDLFWEAGTPLSRSEILEHAENRQCSWKPNSVHILVNSLLDKGALQVAGFYLNARKLGRTFEPTITPEEYAYMQVAQAADNARHVKGIESSSLMSAIIDDNVDVAELDRMMKMIKTKKQEIQARGEKE